MHPGMLPDLHLAGDASQNAYLHSVYTSRHLGVQTKIVLLQGSDLHPRE